MDIGLMTIIMLVIAVCYWLEENTKWAAHISGVLLIIIIGIILGNSNLVPSKEESYDIVFKFAVPVGIALMLLAFNPREVLHIRSKYLICFAIGAVASIIGGLVAGWVFSKALPADAWRVSGQLTASYIGGYENAVAVGRELKVPTNIFLSAFAGDSIFTTVWMMFNIIHGKFLRLSGENTEKNTNFRGMLTSIDLTSIAIMLAVSLVSVIIATKLNALIPQISRTIWLSLLATGMTFTPLHSRFKGSYVIGSLFLSVFFFACGAISDVVSVFGGATLLLWFPALIVAIHGIILFSIARILKYDWSTIIVASQSLIGGPATALAVVEACRWKLQFEAIVLGLLGYAIANYCGFFVAWLLS